MLQHLFLGVSCEEPDNVANATASASGSGSYEEVRTFTCDSGFQAVSGDLTRVCQASGVWSGRTTVCKGKAQIKQGIPRDLVYPLTSLCMGGPLLWALFRDSLPPNSIKFQCSLNFF